MTPPSRGDIFLVEFPYAELTRSKRRPACVVSVEAFNRGADVLLAMVTSQRRLIERPGLGDAVLERWDAAGLRAPSVVRSGRLLAVQRTLLAARIGRLAASDQTVVDRGLRLVLGLA